MKADPRTTLTQALASAGHPLMALDLRALPPGGPVRAWFSTPQVAFSCGALFAEGEVSQLLHSEPVCESCDGLIFVRTSTPSRGNPDVWRRSFRALF